CAELPKNHASRSHETLLLGQARLSLPWCALGTRHASPTALEPPQLCIDLPRLLSSQCHLSSSSLHRSDFHFGDPARRHIAAYSAIIKAADIELLPICERDNFCRLINPEAKILFGTR